MGFLNFFKKETKISKIEIQNTGNEELFNGLPWGWLNENVDFTGPRDSKLFELSIKYNNASSIDDEIRKIQDFIDYYYKYQKECKEKGKYFYQYFENMHMHCHNSKKDDFEFVELAKDRLNYINSHKDEIIQLYKQKEENYKMYLKYKDPFEDNIKRIKKHDFSYIYTNVDDRYSTYSNSTNTYISTAGKKCIEYEKELLKRVKNFENSTCPYCNETIRLPKRAKKCELCNNKIHVISGRN